MAEIRPKNRPFQANGRMPGKCKPKARGRLARMVWKAGETPTLP